MEDRIGSPQRSDDGVSIYGTRAGARTLRARTGHEAGVRQDRASVVSHRAP
jgi:hypothetical protein